MGCNAAYHKEMEKDDDELMKDFTINSNVFKDVWRNPDKAIIDYGGIDQKDRKCNIEFKRRFCNHNKFETTFIECAKFWTLMEAKEKVGKTPLYLNYYNDCILLYKLDDKDPLERPIKNVKIMNKGYNEYQNTWRYELPINEGYKYVKINDKWVYNGKARKDKQSR